MAYLAPHAAAAIEAEEEAGVRGAICPAPIGSYRYRKRRRNGASEMLDVDVFPLAVTQELGSWKEQAERERRWFPLSEAAEAVEEPDLADIIRSFRAGDVDLARCIHVGARRPGFRERLGGWLARIGGWFGRNGRPG